MNNLTNQIVDEAKKRFDDMWHPSGPSAESMGNNLKLFLETEIQIAVDRVRSELSLNLEKEKEVLVMEEKICELCFQPHEEFEEIEPCMTHVYVWRAIQYAEQLLSTLTQSKGENK